ncbi:hypothetical protein [Micromonospora sp. CPCC 205558]|uniref:hypothetical protein n=1 Tax=Micromonospora sp. CPCC 205558 TaxID=3122403 RepID=UPI002FF027BF
MSADRWKGHVNGILYGIQFDRVLDDTVVTRVAGGVSDGLYPGGRAETLEALGQALRHPGPLNDELETHHSEDSIRAFLHQLSATLTTTPHPRPPAPRR